MLLLHSIMSSCNDSTVLKDIVFNSLELNTLYITLETRKIYHFMTHIFFLAEIKVFH